ncbi:Gmad2 immunoglobulin-like domain-containing protein [Nocardioides sp.]|uniref:Gmad2 immunoglobulin-like domain-containing protein n=1 Tax=Nocardioides sp. TaxID=35761 RepID=UPI003D12A1D2
MTSPRPDEERLRRLIEQSVADLEPRDQLDAIRARTKETPMPASDTTKRPWIWVTLGAAVATAAVIGGFAVLNDPEPSADPSPAGSPSASASDPSADPSETPSEDPSSPAAGGAMAIYVAGDTPFGPRLYREFRPTTSADRLLEAGQASTTGTPLDPDYFSLWSSGGISDVSFDGIGNDGQIGVTLDPSTPLTRPAGMSREEARIAIEQVIYTLQAATQTRAPVQFYLEDNPVATVFGVPTSEPLAQGKPLEVLSLVNLTNPAQGTSASGSLAVDGVASSFEATVPWQLMQGAREVRTGFFTADGWQDKLYPFSGDIDLNGLAPGNYTLVVQTDDPSGGEGPGPFVDTRDITVR